MIETIAAIAAVIVAAYTFLLMRYKRSEMWAWLHNFIATLISIIFVLIIGIFLFNYQSKRSEDTKKQYMSRMLSSEIENNIELLKKEPTLTVSFATEGRTEKVLFAYPSSLVLQDAIRSGLFPSQEVRRMVVLEHNIALYNNLLTSLLSFLTGSNAGEASGIIIVDNINKTRAYLLAELDSLYARIGTPDDAAVQGQLPGPSLKQMGPENAPPAATR